MTLGDSELMYKYSRNTRMLCKEISTERFMNTKKDMKVLKLSKCDAVVDGLYASSNLPKAACNKGLELSVAPAIICQNQVETFQDVPCPRCKYC